MLESWDMITIVGILFGFHFSFIRPILKGCKNLEERIIELENKNSNEEEDIDEYEE